jgi:hypothetical protein
VIDCSPSTATCWPRLDDALSDDRPWRRPSRKQHGELVPAHPRHDIHLANPMLQRSGNALEKIVTALWPKASFVLEVVEIDHQHRASL